MKDTFPNVSFQILTQYFYLQKIEISIERRASDTSVQFSRDSFQAFKEKNIRKQRAVNSQGSLSANKLVTM